MKKMILVSMLLGFIAALSGCNTGDVQVGTAATTPAPSIANESGAGAGPTSKNNPPSSSASGASSTSGTVFFERVQTQNELPFSILSISFLSAAAPGNAPFGVTLDGIQPFAANPIFNPGSGSVTYVRSIDVGTDAVLSTSLDEMQTQQLFGFPQPVVNFSIDGQNSKVAWISTAGAVFISQLSDGSTTTLDTSMLAKSASPTSVQWSPTGNSLFLLASEESLLIYETPGAQPNLIAGAAQATFSPDGTELAYFRVSDQSFHLVDLGQGSTPDDVVMGALESSEIHDLSWSNQGGITYWTRLASGAQEIRTFSDGHENSVAPLSLPAGVEEGVVCPNWSGDTLYFANDYAGSYAIESVVAGKKPSAATVFAQPLAASLQEGFVCPKVGAGN